MSRILSGTPGNSETMDGRAQAQTGYGAPKVEKAGWVGSALLAAFSIVLITLLPSDVFAQAAPVINFFTATPSSIAAGGSSTLSWSTSNASSVTLTGTTTVTVAISGSVGVSPTVTTTYTLRATNTAGAFVTRTATVTVSQPPVIDSFSANPPTISAGQGSTLSWSTTNATTVTVDHGIGAQPLSGSVRVTPSSRTTYTLTARNTTGSTVNRSVTVTVTGSTPPPATAGRLLLLVPGEVADATSPTGKSGTASAQNAGVPFLVTVKALDADWNLMTYVEDTVAITPSDPASPPVTAQLSSGTAAINVTLKTGSSQALTVTDVSDPAKLGSTSTFFVRPSSAAGIAVGVFPSGMIGTPDSKAPSDSYTLVNTGGTRTTVTLAQVGDFFTQTPSPNITLGPGESESIRIDARTSVAGDYEGYVVLLGEGVPEGLTIPIHLLIAPPPAGRVNVRATRLRLDTDESVSSGTAAFVNEGSATANGILVSDVPWLKPQGGTVTIAPGQTTSVSFSIDRSKRIDAVNLSGAQMARLRFVYLTGDALSLKSTPIRAKGGAPRGGATYTVVDTAGTKSAGGGAIPVLGSDEVARFVSGIAHDEKAIADVSLLNAGPTAFSSFKYYFVPSGGALSAAVARVLDLFPNLPFPLGDIVGAGFKASGSGSLQFRTKNNAVFSLSAMRLSETARGYLTTQLATFISSNAAGAGQDQVLNGLRKDASARTDIYLQELAGFPASAQIEFLDASGKRVGGDRAPDDVSAFGTVELKNVVPSGAVVARVSTRTGSGGRIMASARVLDLNGDVWEVVDTTRQCDFSRREPVVVPYVVRTRNAGNSMTTEITITNTSSDAATATMMTVISGSRRRSVGAQAIGGGGADRTALESGETLSFRAGETRVISDVFGDSAGADRVHGYVQFTPNSGEFVVTSRTYSVDPQTQLALGTTVPVVAVSSALRRGDTKHVAGLQDASTTTVAAREAGSYRSSIGLLETTGQELTINLTLHYSYPQALTTAYAAAAREVKLQPRQLLIIDELARSIIGPDRALLGDLHNLQIDIEVTGGDGAVVPFVLSTENGTGDLAYVPFG